MNFLQILHIFASLFANHLANMPNASIQIFANVMQATTMGGNPNTNAFPIVIAKMGIAQHPTSAFVTKGTSLRAVLRMFAYLIVLNLASTPNAQLQKHALVTLVTERAKQANFTVNQFVRLPAPMENV
jgi:sRNA-binding regulator protein Hfq